MSDFEVDEMVKTDVFKGRHANSQQTCEVSTILACPQGNASLNHKGGTHRIQG